MNLLFSGVGLLLFPVVAINLIFHLRVWSIQNEPVVVRGNGSHYVIMLHGLGGTPDEFQNLYPLFDEHNYTIIIPFDPNNSFNGIEESANVIYRQVSQLIKTRTNNYGQGYLKELSLVGNSLGGLITKKLIVKLKSDLEFIPDFRYANGTVEKIKLQNFVTVVTPHYGIGMDETPFNLIRLFISYSLFRSQTMLDLRSNSIIEKTETNEFNDVLSKFKNKMNYVLTTFDLNVPFSSSIRCIACGFKESSILFPTTKEIVKTTLNIDNIKLETVFVPINSLLNHGNVIGKHLNNQFVTWNRQEVLNSINHIKGNFQ